jgi:hypothetical protein
MHNNLLDTFLKDKMSRNWALKTNHFEIDSSAYVDIQKLSISPLHTWIGAAIAPLNDCLIEWNTVGMLQSSEKAGMTVVWNGDPNDFIDRTGMIIRNNKIFFASCFTNKKIVFPYVINLDIPRDETCATQRLYENTVYGVRYKIIHGTVPPFRLTNIWDHPEVIGSIISRDDIDYLNKIPDSQVNNLLHEVAGDARTALAILAYMNADSKEEAVTTQHKKSTFLSGKVYPYPKTNLVVIRPGSTKRVYEYVERNDPLNNRRLHEVRRHIRKLKTGKFVVVRPHKRGNAELGEVTKRYIVEKDPN